MPAGKEPFGLCAPICYNKKTLFEVLSIRKKIIGVLVVRACVFSPIYWIGE